MKILETVDPNPCAKSLTIEISPEDVNREVEELYKELMTEAQIPGFRPGHAPLHLLKMRFDRIVQKDAREKATESACKKVIEDLGLTIVTEPKVTPVEEKTEESEESEEKTKVKDSTNEPFSIKLDFEYIPDFEIKDYKPSEIEIPRSEVTDQDIDNHIERFRQQMAIMVPAPEDKAIAVKDIVTLDVKASCEGEPMPEATHSGYTMEIGHEQHLPGFEEALMGMKAGEEKTIDITLPEKYHLEKYQGKTATFEIKVVRINERRLPTVDDEFAKDLGEFESLEDLKAKVRQSLEEQLAAKKIRSAKNVLINKLLKDNPIPVPPSMLNTEFQYISFAQQLRLRQLGASWEDLGDIKDKVLASNRQQAEDNTRTRILLAKIAELEEIKLSEAEFFEYIEKSAEEQQMEPGRLLQMIQKQDQIAIYHDQALKEKILEQLLQSATIKEVDAPRIEEAPQE